MDLHGCWWHTLWHSAQPPVAHPFPRPPNACNKVGRPSPPGGPAVIRTCAPGLDSLWWSVGRQLGHRIGGETLATAVGDTCDSTDGWHFARFAREDCFCRGYSRSPTGLRHLLRALPENTTEMGCATSSANGPVASLLPTVSAVALSSAAAHAQRLPAPLRRRVIALVRGISLATRNSWKWAKFMLENPLFAPSSFAASMSAQSCAPIA